jgi:hypothetical protein
VHFFSGTFFRLLKPLRGFFIAAEKTSYTTGTLCETVSGGVIVNNLAKKHTLFQKQGETCEKETWFC